MRKKYNQILAQLQALSEGETSALSLCANASALLMHELPKLNWAGFYISRVCGPEQKELVLGPFQGKTACVHIAYGRGVCGTAAVENHTIEVKNVHEFPGHIACDSHSLSEIVVPIHDSTGTVIGVLDVDSPYIERFLEEEKDLMEGAVRILEDYLAATGQGLTSIG